MMIFPLKKEWYEKIRSGEKTVEYREVKPYWCNRLRNELEKNKIFIEDEKCKSFHLYSLDTELKRATKVYAANIKCVLRLGYTKRQMTADITKIEVVDGKDTDLRVDKLVYAIHLANVRETEKY